MTLPDELARLESLWRTGSLTDEEFALAKAKLLSGGDARGADRREEPGPSGSDEARHEASDQEIRTWGLWLHLSMLSGFVVPLAGFVAPILIWRIKRGDLPELDAHGRRAANWLISSVIYAVLAIVLAFVLIGIPLLFVLAVCGIVFPILAGLKANDGELWDYPGAIRFLADPEHEPSRA